MRYLLIVLMTAMAIGLIAAPLYADWPDDPAENLAICTAGGEQSVPKIALAPDNSAYMSWYDHRGFGYAMYLQRIDVAGNPQWAANGLLISDHPQNTWLTNYSLMADSDGNAIVVFNDIRTGGDWDIYAYKISPDGDFLWGVDGVAVSANGDFEADPKITQTEDDNYIIVWPAEAGSQVVRLQKLSPDGQKLWGVNGLTITPSGTANLSYPAVVSAEDDNVIVMWTRYTGPFWAPTTNDIYVQKFDGDGNELWTSGGVVIFNLSGMPGYVAPKIISDQDGGACLTWHDDRDNNMLFSTFAQRVSGNGQVMFAANGVEASTLATRHHLNPTMAFVPSTDELFVFWNEESSGQSQFGVYGQKFNYQGQRQWPATGQMFVEIASLEIRDIIAMPRGTGAYVAYLHEPQQGSMNDHVKALRVDQSGNMVWPEPVMVSSVDGAKGDLGGVVNSSGVLYLGWQDSRAATPDIYAQNVNADGTLGPGNPVGIEPEAANNDFERMAHNYPNPFTHTTHIRFELATASPVTITIFNAAGQKVETLPERMLSAGTHVVSFDGSHLASGTYVYRLQAGARLETGTMRLLR